MGNVKEERDCLDGLRDFFVDQKIAFATVVVQIEVKQSKPIHATVKNIEHKITAESFASKILDKP